MRLIGHLQNEATARCFSDYLLTQGIDNQIDPEGNGVWKIWVHAEEQIDAAQTLWRSYCENPGDPKYQMARQAAHALSVQRKLEQAVAEKKFVDQQRRAGGGPTFGVLTVLLIVASVAVITLTGLYAAAPPDSVWLKKFSITEYQGDYEQWYKGLPEIKRGQVWRLFTPMFIHFNIPHLLFNMLNLYFLGSAVERRQSPWYLAGLVLVIGGMSNFGQYLVSGP
ncbi:MAG: rhomboid family intramembrane serine protease, partial [Pedosphaera sp.]|nr:rhomboid family intramembrane serine protease [Pedosphaera sp.]